jgi:hypothetical protein
MSEASENLLRKPCVRFSFYDSSDYVSPKNAMVYILLRNGSCPKRKAIVIKNLIRIYFFHLEI